MGCDIHLFVERKNEDGTWEPVKGPDPQYRYYQEHDLDIHDMLEETYENWIWHGRHYSLFAILADVRNPNDITPISQPKGLPNDVSTVVKNLSDGWDCDGHSHSYVTLREILDYCEQCGMLPQGGIVSLDTYKDYVQNQKYPEEYYRDIGGYLIEIVMPEEADAIIAGIIRKHTTKEYYVRLQWCQPLESIDKLFLQNTIPAMKSLGSPDDVRLVFWFDS